jgi:hypothetical protein
MGMHFDANGNADSEGLRGNYAGIGYIYDAENDVFYAPQPSEEFVLDTDTWTWWNPTDPESVKPVKPEIYVYPVVEAPAVEIPAQIPADFIDVVAQTVEEPVAEEPASEEPVAPVEETPAETPKA